MKYDEIINHPHFEPKRHARMSKEARAAQFSPYAALTGYDKVLKRTIKFSELRSRRVIDMTDPDGKSARCIAEQCHVIGDKKPIK